MTALKIRYQNQKIRVPIISKIFNLTQPFNFFSKHINKAHILYHRGGGVKKRYRIIDFKRNLWNISSLVLYNEYDPNRTSLITLICYYNGVLSYILSTEGVENKEVLFSGIKYGFVNYGNFLPTAIIPEGSLIHSLEVKPFFGSTMVRAAGTFALLVKKFFRFKKILIRLPSKEEILIDEHFMAVMGQLSRSGHKIERIYKAGILRLKGFRPKVRGVAQNPVDHPHGGGGGRCQVTYNAKVAKNISTKTYKRRNFLYQIVTQRKKRKKKK